MLRDIVVNLLHNLGGRSEVDRYLSEYAEGKRCTVVMGGGLIQDDLEELASALALCTTGPPVVIHGAAHSSPPKWNRPASNPSGTMDFESPPPKCWPRPPKSLAKWAPSWPAMKPKACAPAGSPTASSTPPPPNFPRAWLGG